MFSNPDFNPFCHSHRFERWWSLVYVVGGGEVAVNAVTLDLIAGQHVSSVIGDILVSYQLHV